MARSLGGERVFPAGPLRPQPGGAMELTVTDPILSAGLVVLLISTASTRLGHFRVPGLGIVSALCVSVLPLMSDPKTFDPLSCAPAVLCLLNEILFFSELDGEEYLVKMALGECGDEDDPTLAREIEGSWSQASDQAPVRRALAEITRAQVPTVSGQTRISQILVLCRGHLGRTRSLRRAIDRHIGRPEDLG